jgi:hypothetical protein
LNPCSAGDRCLAILRGLKLLAGSIYTIGNEVSVVECETTCLGGRIRVGDQPEVLQGHPEARSRRERLRGRSVLVTQSATGLLRLPGHNLLRPRNLAAIFVFRIPVPFLTGFSRFVCDRRSMARSCTQSNDLRGPGNGQPIRSYGIRCLFCYMRQPNVP